MLTDAGFWRIPHAWCKYNNIFEESEQQSLKLLTSLNELSKRNGDEGRNEHAVLHFHNEGTVIKVCP